MSDNTTAPETEIPATDAPTNIIQLPVEAVEAPLVDSPSVESQQPASDVSETPAVEPTENKPQSIQELIANIDISNVSEFEIISDLIAGIQQLALRGTIALGLLERIKTADVAPVDVEAEANA